ncbi:unnamed protein product, partial [Allacma fusca]
YCRSTLKRDPTNSTGRIRKHLWRQHPGVQISTPKSKVHDVLSTQMNRSKQSKMDEFRKYLCLPAVISIKDNSPLILLEVPHSSKQLNTENVAVATATTTAPVESQSNQQGRENTPSELKIDRFLARQTIPKDLPFISADVTEWPMFITQYDRTTKLLGLSADENLISDGRKSPVKSKSKGKWSIKGEIVLTKQSDVPFESARNISPMVLLGQDNIILSAARKFLRGPWSSPVASLTPLGWVVHGKVPISKQNDEVLMMHSCQGDHELNHLVKESFSTESFGVGASGKCICSQEDEAAIKIMEDTTMKVGGRYPTGFLWRNKDLNLPDSNNTAWRRLQCVKRRMNRDPKFANTYCSKLEEFVEKGYAKLISEEGAAKIGPKTW